MTYVLMLCVFMSSSGESCSDVATFSNLDACINEANKMKKTEHPNEIYKCEGRRKP